MLEVSSKYYKHPYDVPLIEKKFLQQTFDYLIFGSVRIMLISSYVLVKMCGSDIGS